MSHDLRFMLWCGLAVFFGILAFKANTGGASVLLAAATALEVAAAIANRLEV
jgi:hypothetical protein